MTKFNPNNEEQLTFEQTCGPAMKITDSNDAWQYKRDYIAYVEKTKKPETTQSALEIVNSNLGYYAGYYSDEVRKRVEDLFECRHPVFGSIKENGSPTASEAFKMGLEYGKKS